MSELTETISKLKINVRRSYIAVFSTLIARGKECRGLTLIGRELHSVAMLALICHKERALDARAGDARHTGSGRPGRTWSPAGPWVSTVEPRLACTLA